MESQAGESHPPLLELVFSDAEHAATVAGNTTEMAINGESMVSYRSSIDAIQAVRSSIKKSARDSKDDGQARPSQEQGMSRWKQNQIFTGSHVRMGQTADFKQMQMQVVYEDTHEDE